MNEKKINEKTNLIVVNARYQRRLNFGKYQFSFLGNIKNDDKNIGFLMPHSGQLKKIILKTPFDFNRLTHSYRHSDYVVIPMPLLKIVVKKKITGKESKVKSYTCELHYNKIPEGEVDPLKDELKRVIVYDYDYDSDEIRNTSITGGDTINIITDLTNPKVYEFSKDDDIYLFTFLIELDPF